MYSALQLLASSLSYNSLICGPVRAPGLYGPAPFPGRMSYKATKPGLVSVLYLSIFFIVLVFIRAPFNKLVNYCQNLYIFQRPVGTREIQARKENNLIVSDNVMWTRVSRCHFCSKLSSQYLFCCIIVRNVTFTKKQLVTNRLSWLSKSF